MANHFGFYLIGRVFHAINLNLSKAGLRPELTPKINSLLLLLLLLLYYHYFATTT